jgi:hypothetical protein
MASIIGAGSLTIFAAWLVWILWRGGWKPGTEEIRIALLGKALLISLGGALVVLISLGLAINRRSIRLDRHGFEAEGGDDAPSPATPTGPIVTTTTEVR